jgi:hypothetical protein
VSTCFCHRPDRNCEKCLAETRTYSVHDIMRESREMVYQIVKPAWYAPAITRIDMTRTMAQCGSQQDWAGGEE